MAAASTVDDSESSLNGTGRDLGSINHINDKAPGTVPLTTEDRRILQEPYAVAVSFMGYSDELIIHAVKMMLSQDQNLPISGEMLFTELERLSAQGKSNFPPREDKHMPEKQHYGSDGESDGSEEESMEYADAMGSLTEEAAPVPAAPAPAAPAPAAPAAASLDLETDGEQAHAGSRAAVIVAEPAVSKHREVPDREQQLSALKQKLKALRCENKKLKERQLCRSCKNRPVSITFLPCGHYSFCYDCGQKYNACPICRKTILADVRTFLA